MWRERERGRETETEKTEIYFVCILVKKHILHKLKTIQNGCNFLDLYIT